MRVSLCFHKTRPVRGEGGARAPGEGGSGQGSPRPGPEQAGRASLLPSAAELSLPGHLLEARPGVRSAGSGPAGQFSPGLLASGAVPRGMPRGWAGWREALQVPHTPLSVRTCEPAPASGTFRLGVSPGEVGQARGGQWSGHLAWCGADAAVRARLTTEVRLLLPLSSARTSGHHLRNVSSSPT